MNKVFKSRKFWVLVCGLWLAACGLAAGNQVMGQEKNDQIRVTEEDQQNKCKGTIIVEIAGVELKVERMNGIYIDLLTGENLYNLEEPKSNYDCDTSKVVANRIRWRMTSLSDVSQTKNYKTYYERYREIIEKAKKEGRMETLKNGLQKIALGASEIYILPQELSPTLNKQPVVFSCSGLEQNRGDFLTQGCDTTYLHPSGLFFNYRFNRRNYPAYDHINVDREKREWIESKIQVTEEK